MQQSVLLYLSKNCFDIDRQVSMWAAVTSDYTETQSVWSSSKSDSLILRRAGGTKRQLGNFLIRALFINQDCFGDITHRDVCLSAFKSHGMVSCSKWFHVGTVSFYQPTLNHNAEGSVRLLMDEHYKPTGSSILQSRQMSLRLISAKYINSQQNKQNWRRKEKCVFWLMETVSFTLSLIEWTVLVG